MLEATQSEATQVNDAGASIDEGTQRSEFDTGANVDISSIKSEVNVNKFNGADKTVDEFKADNGQFFGKFKSEYDAMQAYANLEKEYSKLRGSPKEYSLDAITEAAKEKGIELDLEKETTKGFMDLAKKHNLTQDCVNDILNTYLDDVSGLTGDKPQQYDAQAEMEKLGENGKAMVGEINDWIGKNFSEDEAESIYSTFKTADQVKVLYKIRAKALKDSSGNFGEKEQFINTEAVRRPEDVKHEMFENTSRRQSDMAYAQRLNKELEKSLRYWNK